MPPSDARPTARCHRPCRRCRAANVAAAATALIAAAVVAAGGRAVGGGATREPRSTPSDTSAGGVRCRSQLRAKLAARSARCAALQLVRWCAAAAAAPARPQALF
jgi:hypothetical protein